MSQKNKTLLIAGKAIIMVIILTLINCGLLVLSFCLPTAPMRSHVAQSYPLIDEEHQYLQWDQGYASSKLDFWSEYTLYGAAINEDAEGSAFEKAMMMWYIDPPGVDRDKAVEQYARDAESSFDLTAYPRYWLGAVMIMKVLLLVFTIPDIRMLNMFLQIALLAVVVYLMTKKNMAVELILLMTAIFFINPVTMSYSVKFSVEYVPMLISIILILLYGEKIDKIPGGWNYLFAILGSIVSFLCMLSSPLIALGIPLAVMVWCTNRVNVTKRVIANSCYWAGAYALTWAMKWIMCTLFTSYNLIANVIDRMDVYENVDNIENAGTPLVERFSRNLGVYKTPAFITLLVVAIVFLIVAIIIKGKRVRLEDIHGIEGCRNKNKVDVIIGYVLIACIPLAIVVALGNGYAYEHYYMAHRQFAISVLALLCILKEIMYSFLGIDK